MYFSLAAPEKQPPIMVCVLMLLWPSVPMGSASERNYSVTMTTIVMIAQTRAIALRE